jgi:hypothetical protein
VFVVGARALPVTPNYDASHHKHQPLIRRPPQQTDTLNQRRAQASTCSFDGITYQAGENLGNSFVTRCGPVSEWPCFCSPGRDPPVECPYCSMADTDQGLVCAKDGETVSIINLNGIAQSCSCSVSLSGSPQETCLDEGDENQNDNDGDDEFCTIQIYNGTTMRFENGESLGEFLPTRCPGGGALYPCYCNTALANQVDCPYCTWLDYRGDLICARQAQSTFYEKAPGEFLECACLNDFISTCKPMAPTLPPVGTLPPATQPTSIQPSLLPTGQPIETVTGAPTTTTQNPADPTDSPTSMPTVAEKPFPSGSPSKPASFDKDALVGDDRPPLADADLGGCLYLNETTGKVDFVEKGSTFGPHVSGPCSPSEDWPVICNPAISNGGMEYPYCVFAATSAASPSAAESRASETTNASSLEYVCARTQERVLVPLDDGTTQECSCLYFNPLQGPSSSCSMVTVTLELPSFTPGEGPSSSEESSPTPTPNTAQSPFPPSSSGIRSGIQVPLHWITSSFFIALLLYRIDL